MDNKFIKFLNEKMLAPMGKMANLRFVRAIMAAGLASIPFTIVGSMMLVLNVLPLAFPALTGIWNASFVKISSLYMSINHATMGALALYFNIVFAYEYTKIIATETKTNIVPLNGALLSVFAFFMTLPELVLKGGSFIAKTQIAKDNVLFQGYKVTDSGLDRLGTSGIFVGIIIAVLAVKIYEYVVKHNWVVKMPPEVPAGVANSFTALVPAAMIGLIVAVIEGLLVLAGTDIFSLIGIPFSFVTYLTNSWAGLMVIIFLIHFLWFMGIHGANIISAFYTPIVLNNFNQNIHGGHFVFAGEFMNMFVIIGGSGATLGIVIWMTLRARSSQLKILGKTAIVPAFFNINEPILFGCPVVYNPMLLIPFVFAPMVSGSIAYFAIKLGFVKYIIAQVPWPSPFGIGAFIGTGGDLKAAVVAIINVIVAFIIWLPFMKAYDNKLLKQEQANAQ
ncbi:MAG: PTS cellobiose transporter subunit IIC [Lactobacillus sp.]|nr:PTS cellobiose transporter subunit IIC [Lactobacillus sp.]